jgi:hypothetical protein
MRPISIGHEFVDNIPDKLSAGTLYISIRFATAVHLCCCGCGTEVVTPLSPTDWALVFDGETVSLDPSIGNWGFPCQSHYWIRQGIVVWAPRWTRREIAAGRERDRISKARNDSQGARDDGQAANPANRSKQTFWNRMRQRWGAR